MSSAKEKKARYFDKFVEIFEKHTQVLIVQCDNVGSHHMQRIRKSLRGEATILMGKNTMMRKAIRQNLERNPKWAALMPWLVGNIGLVFTDGDLKKIKDTLTNSRVPAAAKVGTVAPQDVNVPKGQTSLEPTKTSFLQLLNIASKINKGTIEILNDVHLIKAGEKVGASEANLLQMLDIRPFTYGMSVQSVYDNGHVYEAEVLDLTDAVLIQKFGNAIANVAAVSLATKIPTYAAFPHVVLNGYKNLMAVALATDYTFEQIDKLKTLLSDPAALAAATAAANAASSGGASSSAAAVEEAPQVEEKPESEDMGFDLFG